MIELRRALPFLTLSLVLLIVGCSLLPGPPTPREQLGADLQAAEARWAARDLSSYRFTVTMSCFCPFTDPMRVTVRDDQVVSVTRDGTDVPDGQQGGAPLLVESAFRRVRDSLGADEITVVFDPALGFPAHVVVNPMRNAMDEEFSFDITDFEAAP